MKTKLWKTSCTFLTIICLFVSSIKMSGQERLSISAGVGFPELMNISLKYQILKQAKIGLSAGWWPSWEYTGRMVSFSGDFYYHFDGLSKYSNLRPWYGRIGFNCTYEDMGDLIMNWVYIYLRVGRDFYFNKKIGISPDIGINYDGEKTPPFSLSTGICFFYRF
jgi:hypothetical protein